MPASCAGTASPPPESPTPRATRSRPPGRACAGGNSDGGPGHARRADPRVPVRGRAPPADGAPRSQVRAHARAFVPGRGHGGGRGRSETRLVHRFRRHHRGGRAPAQERAGPSHAERRARPREPHLREPVLLAVEAARPRDPGARRDHRARDLHRALHLPRRARVTGPAKRSAGRPDRRGPGSPERLKPRPETGPAPSPITRPSARKVFFTGATGYLGSAIAARLLRAGYEVRALARTQERAALVQAMGAEAVLGSFDDPEALVAEMKNCDAVVHVARDTDHAESRDQAALEAIRTAAHDGRVRRLLYTSDARVHGDTRGAIVDETAPIAAAEQVRWRPAHERAALDLADVEVVTGALRR